MSTYDINVYHHPEASGLEVIGVLDEDDLSYEYNTLIALVHTKSGRVFWASDSGCSCPTPFEDYFFRGPDDTNLEEIGSMRQWDAFKQSVTSWSTGYDGKSRVPQHERNEFLDDIKRVLRQAKTK